MEEPMIYEPEYRQDYRAETDGFTQGPIKKAIELNMKLLEYGIEQGKEAIDVTKEFYDANLKEYVEKIGDEVIDPILAYNPFKVVRLGYRRYTEKKLARNLLSVTKKYNNLTVEIGAIQMEAGRMVEKAEKKKKMADKLIKEAEEDKVHAEQLEERIDDLMGLSNRLHDRLDCIKTKYQKSLTLLEDEKKTDPSSGVDDLLCKGYELLDYSEEAIGNFKDYIKAINSIRKKGTNNRAD